MTSTPSTNSGPDYSLTTFSNQPAGRTLPTSTAAEVSDRTNFRTSVINLDRPGDPSVFSEQVRADAAELISRYPAGQGRSALLPLLHLVQSEQGYVTPDGIAFCSDLLNITKAQVAAVATFYTMYKRSPTGEYLVSVCTNTLCGVLGGDDIFAALKEHLGVGNNQTTPDGKITLEHAECLAACDYAPVVTVNYEFFDNQTVGSARNVVSQLQSGERPLPTRGAPLCTFKQIERQIAGLYDEVALAPDAAATGAPTEAGVKLAIQRGDSAPSYSLDTSPQAAQATAAEAADNQAAAEAEKDADKDGAKGEAAPAKKTPARRRSRGKAGTGQGGTGEATGQADNQGPSESDAPLETAESDSENATATGTEKGD